MALKTNWGIDETVTPKDMNDIGIDVNKNTEKLKNVEDGANKYVHPKTHDPTMIATTSDKRFTSDTEMNNKSGVGHKHTKVEIIDFAHTHNMLDQLIKVKKSEANDGGKYTKIATFEITRQYGFFGGTFAVVVGGHGDSTTETCLLNVWIKQQEPLGSICNIHATVNGWNTSQKISFDYHLVEVNNNSIGVTVELYVRFRSSYTEASLNLLTSSNAYCNFAFLSMQPLVANLPTGRNFKATDTSNKHTHDMKDITGLELTANKVNYNKNNKATVENALDHLFTEVGTSNANLVEGIHNILKVL